MFYYWTLDVSTPGVGISGTWVNRLPRLTSTNPPIPYWDIGPVQRMVYFFVKFIHPSAGLFINPSIRKQSSFYLVTFILLYALIRPSTRIHLPIDILQFIHPSTGIRSSFNRNFFILLPEFIHPSAGIFIHPSIGMQSSFYRISLILIHPLIRPSTRIHLPIYWIVFILT